MPQLAKSDITTLRPIIESSIQELLHIIDGKVHWKNSEFCPEKTTLKENSKVPEEANGTTEEPNSDDSAEDNGGKESARSSKSLASDKSPAEDNGTEKTEDEKANDVGNLEKAVPVVEGLKVEDENLPYYYLPGTYEWKGLSMMPPAESKLVYTGETEEEKLEFEATFGMVKEDVNAAEGARDDDPVFNVSIQLDVDNSFCYKWSRMKGGKRPREYHIEIQGRWETPKLNRNVFGDYSSNLVLHGEKIRFCRRSNFDTELGDYKLELKTFKRQTDGWVMLNSSTGLPKCDLTFSVDGTALVRVDNFRVYELIKDNSAGRALAGLSKKASAKLGTPLEVLTDMWFPMRHQYIQRTSAPSKKFNPIICLAEILKAKAKSNNWASRNQETASPVVAG